MRTKPCWKLISTPPAVLSASFIRRSLQALILHSPWNSWRPERTSCSRNTIVESRCLSLCLLCKWDRWNIHTQTFVYVNRCGKIISLVPIAIRLCKHVLREGIYTIGIRAAGLACPIPVEERQRPGTNRCEPRALAFHASAFRIYKCRLCMRSLQMNVRRICDTHRAAVSAQREIIIERNQPISVVGALLYIYPKVYVSIEKQCDQLCNREKNSNRTHNTNDCVILVRIPMQKSQARVPMVSIWYADVLKVN